MKQQSKLRNLMLMITLFISTASIMGDSVITVITSRLYELYDAWAVNLMISGPCIAGLLACPIAGRLCDRTDKKVIMLTGYILYAISGIGGAAVDNEIYMVVMRFFATGICYGLTSTAAMGIITDCYGDEEMRGKVVGWYNAAMALIGGVVGLAAGALAVDNWKMAFAVNWFSIVVIVLIIFFVPACPPVQRSSALDANGRNAPGQKGWYTPLISLLAAFFVIGFCYYTILTMMDLYVADNSLGSSAFTGLLGTLGTVGSFAACSAFGFTYGKLKNRAGIPSYLILGLGFFLLAFFPTKIMVMVICIIMGAAWGNAYSYWWMRCTVVVPEEMAGVSIGFTGTVNSLCGFPVPYILLFLKNTMHTDNAAATFPVYGVICLLIMIIAIFYTRKPGKQSAARTTQ